MEVIDEQIEAELDARLTGLLPRDGSWDASTVQDLEPATWAEWFRARLDGCDPHFGYDREDYATHPANLFRALFDDLDTLNTAPAAQGLAWFLASLNPASVEGVKLREAIDLVLHVRPRYTPARDELRDTLHDWIGEPGDSTLLDRDEDRVAPETLLRKALFALAALQYPGGQGPDGELKDKADLDTFRAWLDHPDVAEAAFSGLGLALPSTPETGVVHEFLTHCEEENINPKYPLETLYTDRPDKHRVRTYLWEEAQQSDDPEERWDDLRAWLADEFYLPSYRVMESRREQYGNTPDGTASPSSSSEGKGPSWTGSYEAVR